MPNYDYDPAFEPDDEYWDKLFEEKADETAWLDKSMGGFFDWSEAK